MPTADQPTARAVYRYEVPVDDRWHILGLSGPIVHVASRKPLVVEVWAYAHTQPERVRCFRVYGTGQPIPPAASDHIGSVLDGEDVWHLLEHTDPATNCPA